MSPKFMRGLHATRPARTYTAASEADAQERIATWTASGYDCYETINDVSSDFSGAYPGDEDIVRRRVLFLDADPANKPAAASDLELAKLLCDAARELLVGWPAPQVVDSGNGYHLKWTVDLPTDAFTTAKVKAFIRLMNRECVVDGVRFDEVVFNLSRILRMPGSHNFKANRPCQIVEQGSNESVTIGMIDSLLHKYDAMPHEESEPTYDDSGLPNHFIASKVKAWAESHGFRARIEPFNENLTVVLDRCPLNHDAHSEPAKVGTRINVFQSGKIHYHCFGESCNGLTIRDLEAAWGESFNEFMGDVAPAPQGINQSVDDPHRIATAWKDSLTVDYVPGIATVDDEFYFRQGAKWIKPTPAKLSAMATSFCQQHFNEDFLRRKQHHEGGIDALKGIGKASSQNDDLFDSPSPGKLKPALKTNRALSQNVIESLRCIVPELSVDQQYIGHSDDDAKDVRRLRDVDLNVRKYIEGDDDCTTPRSVQLFTQSTIDCEWQPDAATPEWDAFLASLQLTDDELRYLQQVIGYAAFPIEPLEKFVMHTGPTRCGKKVIFEVLTALCGGQDNVTSVDFRDFASEFGLQEAPGRNLLLVPEATLHDRGVDKAVQRIKCITGGDAVPINRKNKAPLTTKLDCIIWMSSNERLALADSSAALYARQLLIQFRESFRGREDIHLSRKLQGELSGVLVWALDGLKDLKENNWRFTVPESWEDAAADLQDEATPLREFVSDCFVESPGERVHMRDVLQQHRDWGGDAITEAKLRRELNSMGVEVKRLREPDGSRPYAIINYQLGA